MPHSVVCSATTLYGIRLHVMTYGGLVQFHINMKLSPVNCKGPIARRKIIETIHCHN